MDVWAVVKAAGWRGAISLCDATFTGWEVGFLGYALSLLAAWDHSEEAADQKRLLLQVLGVRS